VDGREHPHGRVGAGERFERETQFQRHFMIV
jgi:hypothetical protein